MSIRITALAAASAMALSACAVDPDPNVNHTGTGAIAGAALGAAVGAATSSDRSKGALRGAIAGAAAGAVAGSLMDQQAKALQAAVTTPGIQIVNHGSYLQVIMPEGILFGVNSAAVSGPAQNDLYAVAQNLNQYPNTRVEVIGHTDATGSAAHNMDLSQRRAQSVAGILRAAGVAPNRIVAVGRGLTQPIASNNTPEGRAQNRRVEIIIRPVQ